MARLVRKGSSGSFSGWLGRLGIGGSLLVAMLLVSAGASASTDLVDSAARGAGESYESARQRYLDRLGAAGGGVAEADSVLDTAGPFAELPVEDAPSYESLEAWTDAFEEGRDTRYIPTRGRLTERRPSWLYPDDGCFARASVFGRHIQERGFVRPYKLFIFGDLTVRTDNHPQGSVSWWYHVVPVVRIGDELYIADPAIDPRQPLTARAWAERQVAQVTDARFALCNEFAYSPGSSCRTSTAASDRSASLDQLRFLDYEWGRQQELGRDPEEYLGDHPPWME